MRDLPQLFEYTGAIHIHTTDSDGTQGHEKIIELGQKYNLDFLMFSDHNTLKSLHKEGRYGRLMAIIGYEINDSNNNNHFLAFGLKRTLDEGLPPKSYVSQVRRKRGLGIIAHPDEVREHPKYPSYPWTDWSVRGFHGIEIWNHMSAWMENASTGNILKFLVKPRSSITAPTREILDKWDDLAQKRKVLGIGAIDVHAIPYGFGPFKITVFPYKVQLQSIRTHVLLREPLPKDFRDAKNVLLNSLKRCNAFFSNYRWGSALGFRFWAENQNRFVSVGERIEADRRLNFYVKSPLPADIHLYHNGEKVIQSHGKEVVFRLTRPGVVRAELYRKGKGWIFTNHIYVTKPRKPKRKQTNNMAGKKSSKNRKFRSKPLKKSNRKSENYKRKSNKN
ncbi:MAG: histidinol-phosphatase [Candidatus Zixiibacteriota bacterium]